jgi:hypothetical protein
MPVSFDENGNPKPYSEINISLEQFSDIFSSIPIRERREYLLSNFKRYLSDLDNKVSPSKWYQFINGSFTTEKKEPGDIDVVNFLDPLSYLKLTKEESLLTSQFEDVRDSKKLYEVDGYAAPIFNENEPQYFIFCDIYSYWIKWFGQDRKKNPKAILKVEHNV